MTVHLDDMALFVEVVKAKGFRGAAAAIGMPDSTLSRRIGALEKAIGLRLLHRTTRKIELTEAGRVYFERCRRIVDEARLAHQQLGAMLDQPSGLLRVSLPVDLATNFLAPRMAEFARRYPGIRFDFDLSPRRVDLVAEPFDVAVRVGPQQDSTLIARKLAELSRCLYAAPAYIAEFGAPTTPDDLAAHECLMFGAQTQWPLVRDGATVETPVSGRYRTNSAGMIHRLAIAGAGIAVLAGSVIGADLEGDRLRRVLPDWEAPAVAIHAVTETRLLPAKTQRFIEFLQESLRQLG